MPPGAATHGNRCQTVAGRTHPWRVTRQRRRHFRRGVLAACGRARWKIENETFNVLKTNGYNLEHNFGHGKKTLASVLVTLNLLAFAFHTAAYLGVIAWRAAVIARGPTYRFFEHLRTITAYVVFPDWPSLLRPIAAAALRPPWPEARLPPSRHSIHLNTEPKRRKTSTKSEFRIAGKIREFRRKLTLLQKNHTGLHTSRNLQPRNFNDVQRRCPSQRQLCMFLESYVDGPGS